VKEERGKIKVYIKIMYKEPLLVPYTLGNTVIFPKHRERE
jgi:hypothetical protein